jgi:hypothetical protein
MEALKGFAAFTALVGLGAGLGYVLGASVLGVLRRRPQPAAATPTPTPAPRR